MSRKLSAVVLFLLFSAAFSWAIVVDFTGNIPAVSRVLADFTKVTNVGTNWPPNFVLGNGYSKSAKLHFKDNLLKIWLDQGTVVILR